MEDTLSKMKSDGWPGLFLFYSPTDERVARILNRYPWGDLEEKAVIKALGESRLEDLYRQGDPPLNRLFLAWDGTLLGADRIEFSNVQSISFRRSCEEFLKAHGFPDKGYRPGAKPRDMMRGICGTGLKKYKTDVDELLGIEDPSGTESKHKKKS